MNFPSENRAGNRRDRLSRPRELECDASRLPARPRIPRSTVPSISHCETYVVSVPGRVHRRPPSDESPSPSSSVNSLLRRILFDEYPLRDAGGQESRERNIRSVGLFSALGYVNDRGYWFLSEIILYSRYYSPARFSLSGIPPLRLGTLLRPALGIGGETEGK